MNTFENEVVFTRVGENINGLSNMSDQFPVRINNFNMPNCENLFQALKFPDFPELQFQLLSQKSRMGARTISNKQANKPRIRSDWKEIELEVMAYSIRAKLIWNWVGFGVRLRESSDKTIFENTSKTDSFWGVVSSSEGLRGKNHLGILLMGLRDEYLSEDNEVLHLLTPPDLGLMLGGEELKVVDRRRFLTRFGTHKTETVNQMWPYRVDHTTESGSGTVEVRKEAAVIV